MLIVVNAIFSMFSFCKLLYLNMFRRGAREAVRVFLVFPQIAQICTDAVRGVLFSTQIAPLAPRSKREFCYNVTCYMLQ